MRKELTIYFSDERKKRTFFTRPKDVLRAVDCPYRDAACGPDCVACSISGALATCIRDDIVIGQIVRDDT